MMQKTQYCREQLAQQFSGHLARILESRSVKMLVFEAYVYDGSYNTIVICDCLIELNLWQPHPAVCPVFQPGTHV